MKIKTLFYLAPVVLLVGCKGFDTTVTVGFENKEGQRFDASARFSPRDSGKRVARTASK